MALLRENNCSWRGDSKRLKSVLLTSPIRKGIAVFGQLSCLLDVDGDAKRLRQMPPTP